MTKTKLFELIVETSSELESAKYTLASTPAPRISYSDIEDVSDAYQERLEYNWWVDEQKGLIESLERELAGYKEQMANQRFIVAAFQTWTNGSIQVSALYEGEDADAFIEKHETSGTFATLHTFTDLAEARAKYGEFLEQTY